jgi:hypothetical protein
VTYHGNGHVNQKPSRSRQLIELLICDGVLTEDDLARELVVRPETLENYRSGRTPMPHERQLCLGLLMTQLPGNYARMGYGLLGQVRAARDFENRVTATHDSAPA